MQHRFNFSIVLTIRYNEIFNVTENLAFNLKAPTQISAWQTMKRKKTKSIHTDRKNIRSKLNSRQKRTTKLKSSIQRIQKQDILNVNKRNRSIDTNKSTRQSDLLSPRSEDKQHSSASSKAKLLSKDIAKLKTLHIVEPWLERDELNVSKAVRTTLLTHNLSIRKN